MPSVFNVHGIVCTSAGLPRAGLTVKVFKCAYGLANTFLGQVETDAQGQYSLLYPPGTREDATPCNIFLEVLEGNRSLTVSDIIFNVKPEEIKSFIIDPVRAPEFRRYAEIIWKLLRQIGPLKLGAKK
jgi:hypothetical protein